MSIELRNVSMTYGKNSRLRVNALKNISLSIDDGEFVGIMGRTGCGKSTLIQLIAGLLEPSEGHIIIDGADINDKRFNRLVLRKAVGIVFQYPEYQLFETTVERDVAFALKHSGLSKAEVKNRVKWALEMVGFSYEEIREKSPLALSGGEKRKVAIAGVIVAKPHILIFDEPIAGLDPYGRQEFLELISKLNREGTTILMVSHNTDCLCEYAHRIIVLDDGVLVADGTPKEVFEDFKGAESLHIGVGNVRYIAQCLYQRGIITSPAITRCENLIDELKTAIKGGDSP